MCTLVGELHIIHSLMQAKLRRVVERKDRSHCPLVGRQDSPNLLGALDNALN